MGKIAKDDLEQVASEYGYSKMEDLYAALGYGKFSARQVLGKVAPGVVKDEPDGKPATEPSTPAGVPGKPSDGNDVIRVQGADDLLVYRAKCCNPIRGEAIVGYVTRGKGVAVHSRMCPNVQNLMYDVELQGGSGMGARHRRGCIPGAHRGSYRRSSRHAQSTDQCVLR